MVFSNNDLYKYLLWIAAAIAVLVLIKWGCKKSDEVVEGLKSKSSDEDDEDANEKMVNMIKKTLENQSQELQSFLGKVSRQDQEDIIEKVQENAKLFLRFGLIDRGIKKPANVEAANHYRTFIEETIPFVLSELDETSSADKTVGGFF